MPIDIFNNVCYNGSIPIGILCAGAKSSPPKGIRTLTYYQETSTINFNFVLLISPKNIVGDKVAGKVKQFIKRRYST